MEEIEFHHSLPIQLRFNDVDKFGHVNNTVYFSFYDLGKTEYFASVCPGVDWEKDGIVVVHIEADFLAQIFSSDHIAVQTAASASPTPRWRKSAKPRARPAAMTSSWPCPKGMRRPWARGAYRFPAGNGNAFRWPAPC